MIFKDKVLTGTRYFRLIFFLLKEKTTGLLDTILLLSKIPDRSIRFTPNTEKKQLVVVGQVLNHRIIKIVKWLHASGCYEIIVVCHRSSVKSDLYPNYYDKLVVFRNKLHLQRLMQGASDQGLLIAFASKPSYAEIAIKYSRVPTIFDVYDCMVIYHGKTSHLKWLRKELISEEYCFKNASAILARSPENRMALKMYDIQKKPGIYFADYCDNEYFVNNSSNLATADSVIHITYAGGIHGKHLKNKLAQGLTDFYSFIEHLEEQGIHFHIYPSPLLNKENYYDYVEAAKELKYLHIHTSIPQHNLSLVLSAYHFGVLPHFRTHESKISDDKLERATSLKFYNYLEAGMPILVSSEMGYMAWLVKRYSIGIVFDRSDFPNMKSLILAHDYEVLKRNVLKARTKLSMAQNLPHLIKFLDDVQTRSV